MAGSAFYQKTRVRLEKYGVFAPETLDFAARQTELLTQYDTYQELFSAVDVPLKPHVFMDAQDRGVPVVDIASRTEKQDGVLVVYLPMGNSLDTNQLYQIAALAHAFDSYRIIAFGNPSGKPYAYREQNLRLADWLRVVLTKHRRAVVSTECAYLEAQEIRDAYHVGYSFGALKALLMARYGQPDEVKKLVLLDPVAHSRGLKQLLGDFKNTFKPLGEYVNRTELQTFLDARDDAAALVKYTAGLYRPVNIAIGIMLARVDFISLLKTVLQRLPKLAVTVAWGTKSELGNDAHLKANLHVLAHEEAKGRVEALRLTGDTHAFANDLALYTAIVHDAVD